VTTVLAVPRPTVTFDDVGGGAAALEKPLTVLLGPVTESGAALTPAALTRSGLALRRRTAPGAQVEIWDDGAKSWGPEAPAVPASSVSPPKPIAVAYKAADPNPWQGIVVAAGMKDAAGAPVLAKATQGYPQYTISGTFAAADGATGDGPQTAPIMFASVSDRNLVALGAGDGEQVDQATQARLLLKDPSLQVIGGITIMRDSPGATVRVDNAAGASIVLHTDGSIELTPAAGQGVRIAGDVETEHLRYLPVGGGPKKDLN
jgi:hypothetical protein